MGLSLSGAVGKCEGGRLAPGLADRCRCTVGSAWESFHLPLAFRRLGCGWVQPWDMPEEKQPPAYREPTPGQWGEYAPSLLRELVINNPYTPPSTLEHPTGFEEVHFPCGGGAGPLIRNGGEPRGSAVSNLSVDVLKTQRLASRASGTVLQLRQYKGAGKFGTCDLWFFLPTSIFSSFFSLVSGIKFKIFQIDLAVLGARSTE